MALLSGLRRAMPVNLRDGNLGASMKHRYIGARLHAARIANKVSVQQLASELGVSVSTVLAIEDGATLGHSSTIVEMGRVLGLSLSDLFGPSDGSNIIPFPKAGHDK